MSKSFKIGKIIFIISLILYILLTAIMTLELGLIYARRNLEDFNLGLNIAAFLILYVIIFGIPVYSIVLILNIISSILFRKNNKNKINVPKKEKVYSLLSTLFIFIPLITEGIFILICKILAG